MMKTGRIKMAENKKSFLLYCDLIHTVEKLSDENAGKLMKHLLRYVNDTNPVCDELIDIVFEGIKQQLKRDLKHWETVRIKRSEVGKLGGVKSGESRRKKQTKQMVKKRSKTKQNEANEAVTVNVTVTDTVIISIINHLNLKTGKRFSPETTVTKKLISGRLSDGRTLEDFKYVIDVKTDQWLNDPKMNKHLSPDTLFAEKNFEKYLNEKPIDDFKPSPENVIDELLGR